ncbi:unnamed protein product [Diamesa hyperborea]
MSIKRVRNENYQPVIEKEGFYESTGLPVPPYYEDGEEKLWYENLKIHERIYYHNTLSSARRHANFHNYKSPKDSLDIILSSEYNHSDDLFNPVHDVVKQPETNDKITFRRLRNTKDVYIKPPVHLSHPLKIGGVTERLSIHGVKLINSGVHSQITNHGFTRQQGDGNFFNY